MLIKVLSGVASNALHGLNLEKCGKFEGISKHGRDKQNISGVAIIALALWLGINYLDHGTLIELLGRISIGYASSNDDCRGDGPIYQQIFLY